MASDRALIIFDVDGTLIESEAFDSECYVAAISEHLGIARFSPDWGMFAHPTDPGVTAELYLRHLGREPTRSELNAFIDLYVRRLDSNVVSRRSALSEIRGAAGMLATLRLSERHSVAIATGAWSRSALVKLGAAGIEIEGLPFASGDEAIDRCSIFSLAARRSPGPFARTILVGDGVWDVATARSLNMAFLGVGSGARADQLRAAGADVIVGDFSSIETVIAALELAAIPR